MIYYYIIIYTYMNLEQNAINSIKAAYLQVSFHIHQYCEFFSNFFQNKFEC